MIMNESVLKNFNDSQLLIEEFFMQAGEEGRDLYNEISFQIEFGIFLRNKFPEYKVEFERNVGDLFGTKEGFVKKEIDVIIRKSSNELLWAFELKFPRRGQHPEQMFKIVEDIKFCEELKNRGFQRSTQITLVDKDQGDGNLFIEGASLTGIYAYFRTSDISNLKGSKKLEGEIFKPTGEGKDMKKYTLEGTYQINWNKTDNLNQNIIYFCVDTHSEK